MASLGFTVQTSVRPAMRVATPSASGLSRRPISARMPRITLLQSSDIVDVEASEVIEPEPKSLGGRIARWFKSKTDDGLTTKQRLAKMGLAALLSYGFVSNVSSMLSMSIAWFAFNKKVRKCEADGWPGIIPLTHDSTSLVCFESSRSRSMEAIPSLLRGIHALSQYYPPPSIWYVRIPDYLFRKYDCIHPEKDGSLPYSCNCNPRVCGERGGHYPSNGMRNRIG